jgi:hypothetical protein
VITNRACRQDLAPPIGPDTHSLSTNHPRATPLQARSRSSARVLPRVRASGVGLQSSTFLRTGVLAVDFAAVKEGSEPRLDP